MPPTKLAAYALDVSRYGAIVLYMHSSIPCLVTPHRPSQCIPRDYTTINHLSPTLLPTNNRPPIKRRREPRRHHIHDRLAKRPEAALGLDLRRRPSVALILPEPQPLRAQLVEHQAQVPQQGVADRRRVRRLPSGALIVDEHLCLLCGQTARR